MCVSTNPADRQICVGAGLWAVAPATAVPAPAPSLAMDNVTVFAFSPVSTNSSDPLVLDLAPDMVIRGLSQWGVNGIYATDYQPSNYPSLCRANDIRLIGGVSASAIYPTEELKAGPLDSLETRDASGNFVEHSDLSGGMRRATLANLDYRNFLVSIGELQIQSGVAGLEFEELNLGYQGGDGNFDGNEGFDDYHLADFNAYLLAQNPGSTAAWFQRTFRMTADNVLRPDVFPGDLRNNFDYRKYLATLGFTSDPWDSPLATAWGSVLANRPSDPKTNFANAAEAWRYWPLIAQELRDYAYNHRKGPIYITADGIYPYVDFQSVALYDYNTDNPNNEGAHAHYLPLTRDSDGHWHLDGTENLQPDFLKIAAWSEAVAPGAPVVLFLDGWWPQYRSLPLPEHKDYWRIYVAEAYANGLFYAFHLRSPQVVQDALPADAGGEDTYDLFKTQLAPFYRAHAALYHGVVRSAARASVSPDAGTPMLAVADRRDGSARIVHVVNHDYDWQAITAEVSTGIIEHDNVTLTVDSDRPPASVVWASPDRAPGLADDPLIPTFDGSRITVTLPSLGAYDVVTIAY